jgi:hypothetical protein
MLGDSPLTPSLNVGNPDNSVLFTPGALETVTEELAESGLGGYEYESNFSGGQQEPQMSLAAELGVESPPDTPLQERKVEPNVVAPAPVVVAPVNLFNRGRVFHHPDSVAGKRTSATEKGKAKAVDVAPAPRAPRTSALGEKENNNFKEKKKPLGLATGNAAGTTRKMFSTGGGGKSTSSSKTAGKSATASAPSIVGSAKARGPIKPFAAPLPGGPRRVLINSADAPPIGKGWKG